MIALGILKSVCDGEAMFGVVPVRGVDRASLKQTRGYNPLSSVEDFDLFWTSFDWTRSKTDYGFDVA